VTRKKKSEERRAIYKTYKLGILGNLNKSCAWVLKKKRRIYVLTYSPSSVPSLSVEGLCLNCVVSLKPTL
jgi:hypothetical protein